MRRFFVLLFIPVLVGCGTLELAPVESDGVTVYLSRGQRFARVDDGHLAVQVHSAPISGRVVLFFLFSNRTGGIVRVDPERIRLFGSRDGVTWAAIPLEAPEFTEREHADDYPSPLFHRENLLYANDVMDGEVYTGVLLLPAVLSSRPKFYRLSVGMGPWEYEFRFERAANDL